MTWDDLLTRLRAAGWSPVEEDFMDNYGPLAAERLPGLAGRRFRCTYGVARVDGLRFEAYVFSAAEYADDFLALIGGGTEWSRLENVVLHHPGGGTAIAGIKADLQRKS